MSPKVIDLLKLSRRQKVLEYLQGARGSRSTEQIALYTAINKNTLRNDLNELRRNGHITARRGDAKRNEAVNSYYWSANVNRS